MERVQPESLIVKQREAAPEAGPSTEHRPPLAPFEATLVPVKALAPAEERFVAAERATVVVAAERAALAVLAHACLDVPEIVILALAPFALVAPFAAVPF